MEASRQMEAECPHTFDRVVFPHMVLVENSF